MSVGRTYHEADQFRRYARLILSSTGLALVIGFFLASIGAADAGRLGLAITLLVIGSLCGVAGTYLAEALWKSPLRHRVLLTGAVGGTCALASLIIYFYEVQTTPVAARPPGPPITLMVRPSDPVLIPENIVTERLSLEAKAAIPIRISKIPIPQLGYAGFDIRNNAEDDLAFGANIFVIQNFADRPVTLEISLSVVGEGVSIQISGNGKGRFLRQMGE